MGMQTLTKNSKTIEGPEHQTEKRTKPTTYLTSLKEGATYTQVATNNRSNGSNNSIIDGVIVGTFQSLLVAGVALLVFESGYIAESLILFAISYILFFVKLATAGTQDRQLPHYVSGTSWLASQKCNNRSKVKRSRGYRLNHSKGRVSNRVTAAGIGYTEYTTSDDSWMDFHDEQLDGINYIHQVADLPVIEEPTVNCANGKPMLGGVDSSGNPYGTNSNYECIGIDNCSIDCAISDFSISDSFDISNDSF